MRLARFITVAALCVFATVSSSKKYETVPGDMLGTKIYTLDNGLKVYMSVNKETPRIQTFIAVRIGGKNDPADNTGLAHYLEHIMFKGTDSFGTSDYQTEKPLLDEIQRQYDVYRTLTDQASRDSVYHIIDSVSYAASNIAIANEYDKLMAIIGSEGSNAFTSNDVTCYTEDIPSNQIENWAKVQADRFKNMVSRGFHTELEAVYEEYNMGLTDDTEKVLAAADSVLFPNHPYGTQTVIGTQEHLKNPSITAILKQKATYYVPNNTAICVSGDFDPDEFVAIVEKYFGDWQPNPDIPELEIKEEEPITSPVTKDVYGEEAEYAWLSWRYPGTKSQRESEVADIVSQILYNGMAGLMDLDLNQQQKTLASYAETYSRTDHGEFIMIGYPKEGQTLEEVREFILGEVAKLRSGEFSDSLVAAAIANYKLDDMRSLENNSSRAMKYVDSFISMHDWADDVAALSRISAITKQDIVEWAGKWLGENSYVAVYKHTGVVPNIHKILAPKITPIETNRDAQSPFLAEVQSSKPVSIEPTFLDYGKDLSVSEEDGLEVLYKKNMLNDVATLEYRFDKGTLDDPALAFALNYVSYLGTAEKSADEIATEAYGLACDFSFRSSSSYTTVSMTGLDENLGKVMDIVDDLLSNAIPDEEILANLKEDELKSREVSMRNDRACFAALRSYVMFGSDFVKRTTLTNEQVLALTSEELLAKVRSLLGCQHKVLYYGPSDEAAFKETLAQHHQHDGELQPLDATIPHVLETAAPAVYVAHYDSRQFTYTQYSDRGETLDASVTPAANLFNEYFGGGMNTVVFQEMRESRALAYSASARFSSPRSLDQGYTFSAYIGSQNDKLQKAVEGFKEIIEDMPKSERNLEIAKTALDARLRTERTTGVHVLYRYIGDQLLGLTEPTDKATFEALPDMDMQTLSDFHDKWIASRTYSYFILGDTRDLDMTYLRTLGPVKVLSIDEIFGY